MKHFRSPNFRLFLFFLALIVFACAPIWAYEYFFNLDGTAHLYSAYLMLQLLKGNPQITEIYAFNSFAIPNSSGHWLMVLLLNFFSPIAVTRIIMTLTFAGFVASIGWLRLKIVGREGLKTSLLIGAVIGLNWFWFMGFYNFMIGITGLIFTLGLFYGWREEMNWRRSIILSLLFLLVYFSHIISFGILAGSVFLLAFFGDRSKLKKTLIWISLAILPVLPFVYRYRSLTANDGGFDPTWHNLENPRSVLTWISRIATADPLQLIGERTLPFTHAHSEYFRFLAPILWLLIAFLFLTAVTIYTRKKSEIFSRKYLPFLLLFIVSILAATFSPDSVGYSHGGYIRERFLLCALTFFVPIFWLGKSIRLKRIAQFCLLFIIAYQTAALWEFSRETNRDAKEFLVAGEVLNETDKTMASVILMEQAPRFYSRPLAQMSDLFGFEKNVIVWDNYEIGHYIFPIVAKNPADRQFVVDYINANSFYVTVPGKTFDDTLANLDSCLQENHTKITTLIVWGQDARVEAVINKWFNAEPVFSNGRVRLLRHK